MAKKVRSRNSEVAKVGLSSLYPRLFDITETE